MISVFPPPREHGKPHCHVRSKIPLKARGRNFMANPKRQRAMDSLKKIPKRKLAKNDLLSADLPARVGQLEGREKITIRLDQKIIEAAKLEGEKLGVGYQKILNDRLLEIYSLGQVDYLRNSELELSKINKQIEDLKKRVRK